jgi:hypothetical protein
MVSAMILLIIIPNYYTFSENKNSKYIYILVIINDFTATLFLKSCG